MLTKTKQELSESLARISAENSVLLEVNAFDHDTQLSVSKLITETSECSDTDTKRLQGLGATVGSRKRELEAADPKLGIQSNTVARRGRRA